jgi:hypothetical protein
MIGMMPHESLPSRKAGDAWRFAWLPAMSFRAVWGDRPARAVLRARRGWGSHYFHTPKAGEAVSKTWFSWRFSFVVLGILSAFGRLCGGGISTRIREHPGNTAAELAALPIADPGRQIDTGPVPWRRPRMAPMMMAISARAGPAGCIWPGCRPGSQKITVSISIVAPHVGRVPRPDGSWTTPFIVSLGLLLCGAVLTYWFQPDRLIDAVHSVGGLAAAGERTSDEKFPDTEHHSGSSVQIGKRRILIGDYRLWSAQDSIERHVGE